jgi:hypothetical protein
MLLVGVLLFIAGGGGRGLKTRLVARRDELRAARQRTDRALAQAETKRTDEALAAYYSDTLGPIVHRAMHVAAWRKNPRALAERLGLPLERIARALDNLERGGFVRQTPKGYEVIEGDIHLAPESALSTLHSALFRMRALERRQAVNAEAKPAKDLFFTATFAATDALRLELKGAFLETIERLAPKIRRADADDVFHLNFDLFQV